jgi:long-subunit acyl-CoA synthetase (AMP-forming)
MVVGDGQPFIAALVTIDPETFPGWAEQHGKSGIVADLVDDPDLRAEVEAAVDEANKAVSKAEAIRKFAILPHPVDRGGRAAHPEPQAEAQRRDAREPRRRRGALQPLKAAATLTLVWPLGHLSWSFRAMRRHIRNARSRFASVFPR